VEDDVRSLLFGSLLAVLVAAAAVAQSNPQNPAPGATSNTSGSTSGTGTSNRDANAAINTGQTEQTTPATGANSFTRAEARRRIARHGYTNVTLDRKDAKGVWRGTAEQNGQPVHVWLDYKGDVGQQQQ
jgi:hypothetical protein